VRNSKTSQKHPTKADQETQGIRLMNGNLHELLTALDLRKRSGPPTQFQLWHLLAAFLAFCQTDDPLGRYDLGAELRLGGGSIRSLVRLLHAQGLIHPVGRRGHELSAKGRHYREALQQVLVKIAAVPRSSFTVDLANVACQLRGRADCIVDGVRQRDAAMQAGATGATTLVQGSDPNVVTMPLAHHIFKAEVAAIVERFALREGDVLIIGSAPSERAARLGALAAALTVLSA
jgi:hypothetical protein